MASGRTIGGVIEAALPRRLYRVRTEEGQVITASVSANAQRVTVKLLPGDQVVVEISSIDPSRGRITNKG